MPSRAARQWMSFSTMAGPSATRVQVQVQAQAQAPRRAPPAHFSARRLCLRRSPRKHKSKPSIVVVEDDDEDGKPMKRTLSFDQASAAASQGKRKRKTLKQQTLRKTLGQKLTPLDGALFRGDFHKSGKFIDEQFFEKASPLILDLIGEEFSDEELPDKCMRMAKDIVKKTEAVQRRQTWTCKKGWQSSGQECCQEENSRKKDSCKEENYEKEAESNRASKRARCRKRKRGCTVRPE